MHQLITWVHGGVTHAARLIGHLSAGLTTVDWLVLAFLLLMGYLCGRIGMWAYCVATLPGTIAHELAHYLVALVLGARPSPPSIIPERTKTGWRLGSVHFSAGIVRAVPIALAPLALAPLSLWWAGSHLPTLPFGPLYLGHAWIASTAFGASLPSSQDWSIAAPTLAIIALISGAALLG